MSDNAIEISGLSKAYRIGLKEQKHDTLGKAITTWLKSPVTNFTRLRNLSKIDPANKSEQDIFWALKDVSVQIPQGEILGIIGRNGAGKSTLLKILSKITDPTQGEIRIRGRVASLLEVGTGFNPELTGRENTFLNGTILGMTKKEVSRKFDEIVAFSGVEKFIDTPVKRYSSGMKVRLGFAVAAHLEPEILIIDEVLAVGDAEFQKKCLGKMQGISATEGRTVLFVSHDMSAIGTLCNNCVLLEKGKVDMIGDTTSVVQKYTKNITEVADEAVHSSTIFLRIDEIGENELSAIAVLKILETGLLPGVFHLRIYDGANSELVFYRESDITILDNETVAIFVDISSLKGGYYTLQVRYTASKSDLQKRIHMTSDFVPFLVNKDPMKYGKGQIAPRIKLVNTTTNTIYCQ